MPYKCHTQKARAFPVRNKKHLGKELDLELGVWYLFIMIIF